MPALNPEYMAHFRAMQPATEPVLKWIAALRSGTYTQYRSGFITQTRDPHACCLGVAALLNDYNGPHNATGEYADYILTQDLGFANVQRFKGDVWWVPFMKANDDEDWTFAQIADWLETAINLQRLIDLLANLDDGRFNMSSWRSYGTGYSTWMQDETLLHNCGTTACLAGWGAVFHHDPAEHPNVRAREALGLTPDQGFDLFQPGAYADKDRARAIQTLINFRDTGEISWA